MSPEYAIHLVRHALYLALELALPLLLIAMVTGILFSFIQSFTKAQESSFTFIPKVLTVFLGFALLLPWMFKLLTKFTLHLFVHQWDQIVQAASHVY
jgi:flagellar biosynthesis protein FliQ